MNKKEYSDMLTLFTGADIAADDQELRAFELFYDLLIRYNDDMDLSRLKKFDDIVVKHFIDSLYIVKLIGLPSPLVDIGTGAGFPGIPLSIVKPDSRFILAEHRSKRVQFIKTVKKELALENVELYPHLVTEKSFFPVNGVITRALESINDTMSRVCHFLPHRGLILFMKGPGADEDLTHVSRENSRHFTIEDDISYTLPGTDYERRLITARKIVTDTVRTYTIMHDPQETPGTAISSKDNARFKELKKTADNVKKSPFTIVTGKKIITDIIGSEPTGITADKKTTLIIHDGYREHDHAFRDIITGFEKKRALVILKKSLYNELDTVHSGAPLLIMEKPVLQQWDHSMAQGCALAIPFQDPVNVGSVIRSAAGFGITTVIMLEGAASPWHPRAIRTSAGAVFTIRMVKGPSLEDLTTLCSEKKIPLLFLDAGGRDIETFTFPDSFVLVPGIEGPGLPDDLKTHALSIPLYGQVESLNASAAVSIALYEWRKRFKTLLRF